MTDMTRYRVVRKHLGDRIGEHGPEQHRYLVGEIREARAADVGHLLGRVLVEDAQPQETEAALAPQQPEDHRVQAEEEPEAEPAPDQASDEPESQQAEDNAMQAKEDPVPFENKAEGDAPANKAQAKRASKPATPKG